MNGNVQQGLFFNPVHEDIMHVQLILERAATCKANKSQCTQSVKINRNCVDFNFLGIVAEISQVN